MKKKTDRQWEFQTTLYVAATVRFIVTAPDDIAAVGKAKECLSLSNDWGATLSLVPPLNYKLSAGPFNVQLRDPDLSLNLHYRDVGE